VKRADRRATRGQEAPMVITPRAVVRLVRGIVGSVRARAAAKANKH